MKKNEIKYTMWTARGTKFDASSGPVVSGLALAYSLLNDEQKARLKVCIEKEDRHVAEHRASKGGEHQWGVGGICRQCGAIDLIAPPACRQCNETPASEEPRS